MSGHIGGQTRYPIKTWFIIIIIIIIIIKGGKMIQDDDESCFYWVSVSQFQTHFENLMNIFWTWPLMSQQLSNWFGICHDVGAAIFLVMPAIKMYFKCFHIWSPVIYYDIYIYVYIYICICIYIYIYVYTWYNYRCIRLYFKCVSCLIPKMDTSPWWEVPFLVFFFQDSWFYLKVEDQFTLHAVFDGHGQKGGGRRSLLKGLV